MFVTLQAPQAVVCALGLLCEKKGESHLVGIPPSSVPTMM